MIRAWNVHSPFAITQICERQGYNPSITELVDNFIREAEACSERGASVVVCAPPMEALDLIDPEEPDTDDTDAVEGGARLPRSPKSPRHAGSLDKTDSNRLADDLFRKREA